MERIVEQGRQFGLIMREISPVTRITKNGDRFGVTTGNESIESLGVIVATGTTPIKLGVPGEEEFQGRGVSYCATCDGWFFADLDVAVIGGGDAAIEEGLTLANIVRKVYVVHRRDRLRAQKILQERAFANSRMEFLMDKMPVRISGHDEVESIRSRGYEEARDNGSAGKRRLRLCGIARQYGVCRRPRGSRHGGLCPFRRRPVDANRGPFRRR